MVELRDKESGEQVGTISESQLQFMMDQLEEESSEDRDYHISTDTIDMFEEAGADRDLIAVTGCRCPDAVATEFFFERPHEMRTKHPALYDQLRQFYRQDPASYGFKPAP
jgi:processive 1,2-diacylglycerol beta-glucosyltransferase